MHDSTSSADNRFLLTDIKISLGHLLLLSDMCFYMIALIDAHLKYQNLMECDCLTSHEKILLQVWGTIGYIVRLILSFYLLISKILNLYKFIEKNDKFPKIGAIYSPCMTTLLLSVLVYDYDECSEISSIFSLNLALDLISGYSVIFLVLILLVILANFLIHIVRLITKKHAYLTVLILLLSLIVIVGCALGLIICIELLKDGKVYVFILYDLVSFITALVLGMGNAYRRTCEYVKGNGAEGLEEVS